MRHGADASSLGPCRGLVCELHERCVGERGRARGVPLPVAVHATPYYGYKSSVQWAHFGLDA